MVSSCILSPCLQWVWDTYQKKPGWKATRKLYILCNTLLLIIENLYKALKWDILSELGKDLFSTSPTSFFLFLPSIHILLPPTIPPTKARSPLSSASHPLDFPDSLIIEKHNVLLKNSSFWSPGVSQDSRFSISTSKCISDSFLSLIARVNLLPDERIKALPTLGN